MRPSSLVGLASVLLTTFAASACAPVSLSEEAIVGGTFGGNSSVLWIYDTSSGGLCSASLIAPRVVLTAKHCVQNPGRSAPVASQLIVGTGNYAGRGRGYRAQEVFTTPGVWNEDSRTGLSGALIGVDVAVIVLNSPVEGVTPLPILRTDPRALRGQPFTACGFGLIPGGDSGVKYTAMGNVEAVNSSIIYVGNIICQGDSGGPMILADGSVGGVVSFGNGTTCGTGTGAYNALFPFLDMIDTALMAGGTCVNTGAELCDGRDNNCNDEVDETCIAVGEECSTSEECVGGLCADTLNGRRCTTECDARNPSLGCDDGFYCAGNEGQCGGFCVASNGGTRAGLNDTSCTNNEDCASLLCANRGDGMMRCLTPCEAATGSCPASDVCVITAGVCGGCVDASLIASGHQLGEPCLDASQCSSNNCLTDAYPSRPARQFCTRECAEDSECGDRFHCRDGLCIAGPRGRLGDTCVSTADCLEGAFCAAQGARRWCTQTCGTCESGFTCTDITGTQICVPDAGLVGDGCSANADCVTGLCALGAGIDGMPGTCTRNCGPATPCPTGLACQRLSDGSSSACIWPAATATPPEPTSSGGCRAGSGNTSTFAVFVGLLLAAVIARRRRA